MNLGFWIDTLGSRSPGHSKFRKLLVIYEEDGGEIFGPSGIGFRIFPSLFPFDF